MSIYAEYLPKLGRLSIVAHLPSVSTDATKTHISNDASRLILTHEGVISELALPVKTTLRGERLPGVIPPGLHKLSWGLRPDPSASLAGSGRAGVEVDAVVPWSAADLQPGVGVVCRRCGTVVVERDSVKVWKDLPSENWAEMMEFWHCHKPTTNGHDKTGVAENGIRAEGKEEKASEQDLASRGYGANSAIVAQLGVGFVDLTKMLFHSDDSRCVVVTTSDEENKHASTPVTTSLQQPTASCPGCGTQLGHLDPRKGGVSLFKWKLNLVDDDTPTPDPPTLSQCLAAALVANQARSGSAKVVLQGERDAITIWVLNPHVRFSCLAKAPIAAMKLLYQDKEMDEDEINLPDEAIGEVRQTLQEGSRYLPPDEKTKQFNLKEDPWIVTLLERRGL